MYDKGVVEHLKISSLYWTLLWFRSFYGCNSRLGMVFGGWSNGGRKPCFFGIDHRCKLLKRRMICGNGGRWSKKLRLACACARGMLIQNRDVCAMENKFVWVEKNNGFCFFISIYFVNLQYRFPNDDCRI